MIKIINVLIMIFVFSFTHSTNAGSYQAGKEKSQVCAACHGIDGISQIKMYPILAGQHEYRSGIRDNVVMKGFAAGLSDQDIEDLSHYFSMQQGLKIPPLK